MKNKVLIVDDSPSLRLMVGATLEMEGYETEEASDGEEALKKLKTYTPNLILLDVNMPNMDGLTALREIKKQRNFRFIPVIMLTTESDAMKIMTAKKSGVSGWIVKPFNEQELLKTISLFVK